MQESSRTKNSIKNTVYGVITQFLTILISFVTRTIFIKYLSVEYLGINGLFTNILTVLSLAELGFGGAMIYSMYEPLANQNHDKIRGLMNYYSKVYKMIGVVVAILGLLLIPILPKIVGDAPTLNNLTLIYLFFLSNSVVSYFYAYKRSILQADQKQYIISKNYLIFNILKSLFQIVTLIVFKNYLFFLSIQVITTLIENLFISKIVDKIYPYLKEEEKVLLDSNEKETIGTNVRALMIYKVGSTFLDGTDNIIISSFVGVKAVGYLSNYTLIIGSVSMVLQQLTNALTGSIGHYVATEEVDKQEILFRRIVFIYFIVFGFSFVALFMLLNPFITIWLGESYTLPLPIVFTISLNWYIAGIMNPVWTFRSTKGLFVYGKFRPLVSAVVNVVISIILAIRFGLLGVLIGTTITRISTNLWFDPYIIYKYGFKKSPVGYYWNQIIYFISLMISIFIINYLFNYLPDSGYPSFVIKVILVIVISIVILLIFYRKKDEFSYLIQKIQSVTIFRKNI